MVVTLTVKLVGLVALTMRFDGLTEHSAPIGRRCRSHWSAR